MANWWDRERRMIHNPKPTIPKTTSGPANPNQPSFLTILPPELRKRIYELLFKRDEPVLLHDGEAYRDKLRGKLRPDAQENDERFWRPDQGDEDDEEEDYWEELEIDVEPHVKDDDFHHSFGEGIGLLLSCRQIYHEAAGILYGHNTFLFFRVLDMENDITYN
jgi:hypothetical protein